jgi:uncharacterized protein (TIGR01777 family)
MNSRAKGTATLAKAVTGLVNPPSVFVSMSAVGFYGETGEREVDESSGKGDGFLADVVDAWEHAAAPVRDAGIRTVNLRTGIVLGAGGGALKPALLPTKLGLGAWFGDGTQWMSWISLHDQVRLIEYALENESMSGIYNAVTPHAVRNKEYSKALGKAVGRPVFMKVPAPVLKLALGDVSSEILGSIRVVPRRLTATTDFQFEYP